MNRLINLVKNKLQAVVSEYKKNSFSSLIISWRNLLHSDAGTNESNLHCLLVKLAPEYF